MTSKANQMSAAEHAEITAAVGIAEAKTDGEIVTIVARQSDDYREFPLYWASFAAFISLACVAAFPAWFEGMLTTLSGGWAQSYRPGEYLAFLLLFLSITYVVVWLLVSWRPVRMRLTPNPIKRNRVRARAVKLFKVGTERRTIGLTGILIYLSMAEHRAEIVVDDAIASKVAPEIWGDAMAMLISHVRKGQAGTGMAAAVQAVGAVLAEHFPKSDANPNELPDRLIEL